MDGVHNDRVERRQSAAVSQDGGGRGRSGGRCAPADSAWADLPHSTLPTVTLGKTGQKVPALGMGTSWDVQPSFVQAALAAGVRYIDTSESYESGNCEKTLGEVLERTKMRKDVYLVTKNSRGKVGGPRAFATYEKRLNASLERLRTDYVDCYYLHGVDRARDPAPQRSRRQGGVREAEEVGQDQVLRSELPRSPAARDRRRPPPSAAGSTRS